MADSDHLTTLAALKRRLRPQPSGGITSVAVVTGGSEYTSAPTVSIADDKGSGAVVTAVLTDDVVTDFVIESPGNNYVSPVVTLTGGDGTGATASATIDEDETLAALVVSASNVICNQLSDLVIAADTTITETRDGRGNDIIVLRRRPATAIISVSVDGMVIQQRASVNGAGWVLDTEVGAVRYPGGFTRGVQNIVVVYKAGLPAGDSRLGALEQAALATAALWWKRNPYAHVSAESAPQGMGTSISVNTDDLPKEVWTIIRRLRGGAIPL